MMFVRIHLRFALIILFSSALVIIILWSRCGKFNNFPRIKLKPPEFGNNYLEEIDCRINGDYIISCRRENDEVFLPFTFLQKYFEVYGKFSNDDGTEMFEWSHSYSKVYHPKNKYDPRKTFITFENYNVEVRERVKCISGEDGIPMSTQWEPQGYFYPTQIAQFGLAHYSKNLTEPEPKRKIFDDSEAILSDWETGKGASISRTYDTLSFSNVIQFITLDSPLSKIWLKIDYDMMAFVISFDILLESNSTITIVLENKDSNEAFNLHYLASNLTISAQGENVYHGIGHYGKWRHVIRDLIIDLQKGFAYQEKSRKKILKSKFKVTKIILCGRGIIDNITLSTSEHMGQFYSAASWLLKNQDLSTGGWPIPVHRKIAPGFAELKPGWYSAMSQGHAISVLSRAYYRSKDSAYLHAALKALRPFKVPSWQGGVATTFLDKYVWYEEYPTVPASFVLNGLIYALLGLYDFHMIVGGSQGAEAKILYEHGIESLSKMLLLFDTGSGTVYDLRHFTLGVAPNLARWDYHATHVNQLWLLASLEKNPIFSNTAKRWESYMKGKRAPHN